MSRYLSKKQMILLLCLCLLGTFGFHESKVYMKKRTNLKAFEQLSTEHPEIYAPIPSKYEAYLDPPAKGLSYYATRYLFLSAIYKGASPLLMSLENDNDRIAIGREFFLDIGGESIKIPTPDGGSIDAIYFDPDKFATNEQSAFEKWKPFFEKEENAHLAWGFQLDMEGQNLREMLRFPENVEVNTDGVKGVALCLGGSVNYETQLQNPTMYLYRKIPTLIFNYRGVMQSDGTPNLSETCMDGVYVTRYLQMRTKQPMNQLAIVGSSLGGGVASFTAATIQGLNVLIDRSFSDMIDVAHRRVSVPMRDFQEGLVEKYYNYSTKAFVHDFSGAFYFFEGEYDALMSGQVETLFSSVVENHYPEMNQLEAENYRTSHSGWVAGGHFGRNVENIDDWRFDKDSQSKLTAFLNLELGTR
ncbi:MAG: hypothetical protein S4CHLAM102_00100 [Chlamydiia bacterium]|nr:hypothetical protein [Chlamydiia bacterium]